MAQSLPDNERIMSEVKDLAQDARKTAPLGAQPDKGETVQRLATIAPIHLGSSHDVIPDRYILHTRTARCANCGTQSTWSEFYALSYLKSRINGSRVRHLTRCERPWFNLPVERIPVGHTTTPFCAECETISLSHLPPPPSPAMLYDLVEPRARGAKPKATKEAPKPTTLDDLV